MADLVQANVRFDKRRLAAWRGAEPFGAFPGTVWLDTGNTADGELNTGVDVHTRV